MTVDYHEHENGVADVLRCMAGAWTALPGHDRVRELAQAGGAEGDRVTDLEPAPSVEGAGLQERAAGQRARAEQ